MQVSLDQSTYIGLDSQDLKFTGNGVLVHGSEEGAQREEFTIEGPIKNFRFEFELATNETENKKYVGYKGLVFDIDAD